MKNTRCVLFCLALLPLALHAQVTPGQSFDQIFDQMQRQMLKGLPGKVDTIKMSPGQSGVYQFSPDSSSYFYFKVDTSFSGGSMPDFFHFDPFGQGNGDASGGFGGFDQMFKELEQMQQRMWGMPPSDATQEPGQSDDGLLPEERIRLREEQEKSGVAPAPAKPPVKPKIKTTRI